MMNEMEQRLRTLEEWMRDSYYDTRHALRTELYQRERLDIQATGCSHLFSALCVNTIDPMAEGQVQFYTPFVTLPGTEIGGLPWAYPISPFGGFDDSGVTWVPPAGSKLALLFENGDVNQAYYFGTFWPSTRGISSSQSQSQNQNQSDGQLPSEDDNRLDMWGITIPEYDCIWEGSRDGYNLGSNQGDQVKQPWNTDNYQTQDWDTQEDFSTNPDANQFITYPHIYGFKTPGKHYWKGQDGDHKCNDKWSHLEMATGRTNILMMKDDHLHPAAQWAFNGDTGNDASMCHSGIQDDYSECTTSNEKDTCEDDNNPDQKGNQPDSANNGQQSNSNSTSNQSINKDEFANPFFKRKEEMRFYKAPESLAKYGNPKCELPQSGIQLQSVGGIQFVMDDSVDQPQGKPDWKLDFDWGCNDICKGKTFWRSMTGHYIGMNDEEDDTLIRNENNGIRIQTATGNKIELIDHTLGQKEEPEEAGEKRGIFIKSTSQHVLEFHDEGNKQFSLPRQAPPSNKQAGVQDGNTDEDEDPEDITEAKSNKAFILLRSGYGLQLRMDDSFSQEETQQQYIQLLAPQKDNKERGPHQMVFQEQPEGPGLVLLRAGGVYYRSSYDDAIEVVGDEENPIPANKFVQVTGNYIVDTEEYYFNHNDLTVFQAEKYIILFAGRDCPLPDNPQQAGQDANAAAHSNAQIAAESGAQGQPNEFPLDKGPCLFPVVVGKDPFVCPFTQFVHYGIMSDPADPTHTKLLHNSLSDRVFASASQDEATKNQEVQNEQ